MSISRIPQTVAPAIVAAIHQPLVFLLVSNVGTRAAQFRTLDNLGMRVHT
jgi:hypothetical protein